MKGNSSNVPSGIPLLVLRLLIDDAQNMEVYGATEASDGTISVFTFEGIPCITISDSPR